MWIEDTPVGFYRASNHAEQVRYVARRLWTAYAFKGYALGTHGVAGLEPTQRQLQHIRALMAKWELTWEQVTEECVRQRYQEAVAWWVARQLGGGS